MISVSGKIWTEQKVNKNLVEKYKQDYGLGDILSKLIISRNYDTSEIYGRGWNGKREKSGQCVSKNNGRFFYIYDCIFLYWL